MGVHTVLRDTGTNEEPIPDRGTDVERWYDEYHVRLLKFLRMSLHAETDAQDVSQEVYLRLLRIPESKVVEHPRAYVFRVAVNVIHDWRAGQKLFETRPPDDMDKFQSRQVTADDYDDRERLERIERALNTLPAHYRATIVLKTQHGLSYKEIAGHLGVSERMVKRYIVKGYARLRDRLAANAESDTRQ